MRHQNTILKFVQCTKNGTCNIIRFYIFLCKRIRVSWKAWGYNKSPFTFLSCTLNIISQIIIRGQLVIASRLSHDLEVKVTATTCMSQITDLTYNLRAKEVTPTYILEQDQIHCIKVRLLEEGSHWSKEIHVSGDEMVDNRMVKVRLDLWYWFHFQ